MDALDIIHPSAVFNKAFETICVRAANQYLLNSLACSYVHPETGDKCINTNSGHAKGHQDQNGIVIAEGGLVSGAFHSAKFVDLVEKRIINLLKAINELEPDRAKRRACATKMHRDIMQEIPSKDFWIEALVSSFIRALNKVSRNFGSTLTVRASVCYACLFGRPEYNLPCGHVICFSCIREFDDSPASEKYPGIAIHNSCILCGSSKQETWPYRTEYRPDLSGIRVLSLGGGGVRGIIQLCILERLEKLLDLDMPLGDLFDLIVGASAGRSRTSLSESILPPICTTNLGLRISYL